MPHHHNVFKALGPVEWGNVPQDNLKQFLDNTFADAQTVIESIPSRPTSTESHGRSRAKTDSAVNSVDLKASLALRPSQEAVENAAHLRKEWKEVKVNPRENPLGINVYKLSSKDGKGAWFARRSTHEGMDFDKWKMGLQREFYESMKVQGAPGSGNIRGIGAERRVEHQAVDDVGQLDVFQLSAQFPGPTAPRDFVVLFLTSDFSHKATDSPQPLRQFMIVSKPCDHPDTPPRQGIIRGQYESVEIIREVRSDNFSAKRSASSADLGRNDSKRQGGVMDQASVSGDSGVAIEWLMVTRSDPGGSVPRFMIERGTPPGIIGDAGKFLDWVKSKSMEELTTDIDTAEESAQPDSASPAQDTSAVKEISTPDQNSQIATPSRANVAETDETQYQDNPSAYSGLYGMITGVFGAATSVATELRRQLISPGDSFDRSSSSPELSPTPRENEKDISQETLDQQDSSSELSSLHSFTSALEKRDADEMSQDSLSGSQLNDSKSLAAQPHERELKKIQERRRKIDEKVAKMQERMELKRKEETQKDAAAQAKAREKHEKEIAKQEAKYRREVKKLEEKREQEQRKAEEKRRKAAEREEKSKLSLELEQVKAERDFAQKQLALLKEQVGALQAQNTELVAKLGRLGAVEGSESSLSHGPESHSGPVSSVTS